jgi:hypothetical protein
MAHLPFRYVGDPEEFAVRVEALRNQDNKRIELIEVGATPT